MALEERIEALEGEMKILKNEIQSTLVDIQEQILTHYYPALRAEEPSPSEEIMESPQSTLSERRRGESKESSAPPRARETSAPPRARETSLEDIMESLESLSEERKGTPKDALTSPEGQPPSRSEEEIDPDTIMELAGWVSDSIERIGGERTGKVIEIYAQERHLAPEDKDILFQFISLSDEENPPEKVGVREMLDVVLKLNKILGLKRKSDVAMALSLIKEENLG